ncbi:transcriptional regulator domain-containing protein [Novosphingobium sp. RL4]|uniref:transcriptional regulator domain-containing protein n=1 Tax=Novosphingobium sp. RL4 TaxID=3109595 RepID=UPI002D777B57|nr:DUF6499 domain-containing protein [Novosphingobium sp. RL4]WRT94469.1 DUF6499 domain-containing protein [Novosphingobium sp. RL4]
MGEWRDAAFYEDLQGIDRAGLMWEWLRRDTDYIEWYRCAGQATKGHDAEAALRWGLHFRGRSMHAGAGGAAHLAC